MRLGKYELLIRLASGGAANVFLARDPVSGRLLALKLLLPSLASNEDFVTMFFTEAQIASQLSHPNIVGIADYGQIDGVQSLAMEYVFGASLSQVLRASARAKRPLTVGALLRITAEVCGALHYAHEKTDASGAPMSLVHRDITPQNVLIGFDGVPKLTDFGIAKATNRGWETQAGIVKGKFSYMSPEQAIGGRVDRRSDIFGLGIVLWEALTGKELFGGSSPLEVLNQIRDKRLLPPSKVVPGLTPIVDAIVMKALKRAPDKRFQTAQEMKVTIDRLIGRAGVQLNEATVARELVDIYGPIVATRTAALEDATKGEIELSKLAELMGGSPLNPQQLPPRAEDEAEADPLGLFAPDSPQTLDIPGGSILPARSDVSFESATTEARRITARRAGTSRPSPFSKSGKPDTQTEATEDLPGRGPQAQATEDLDPTEPPGQRLPAPTEDDTQVAPADNSPTDDNPVMSFEDMQDSLFREFSEPDSDDAFEEETVAVPAGAPPPAAPALIPDPIPAVVVPKSITALGEADNPYTRTRPHIPQPAQIDPARAGRISGLDTPPPAEIEALARGDTQAPKKKPISKTAVMPTLPATPTTRAPRPEPGVLEEPPLPFEEPEELTPKLERPPRAKPKKKRKRKKRPPTPAPARSWRWLLLIPVALALIALGGLIASLVVPR